MSESKNRIRLLLTGGGTGGHLFPALAAAEEMCSRYPETDVLFVGTRRKIDQKGLSGTGYHIKHILSFGLKGKNLIQLLQAVMVLPVAFVQSLIIILQFKPTVVLGVGGYVTGPVIAAAKILGRKTVIHEQNSVPGLANRKLGMVVDHICISLPEAESFFPKKKVAYTGNPIRKGIVKLAEKRTDIHEREFYPTLLVLGGSLGAHRVNELVVEAFCSARFSGKIRVIHQTGMDDHQFVKEHYRKHDIDCVVEPFFVEMAEIYAKADLLISRAGATTLAELAILGKPAILIPYPYAADNHQHKNADHYTAAGGCIKFAEEELTVAVLAEKIESLISNKKMLFDMGEKMRELGMPQAASKIVDVCLSS